MGKISSYCRLFCLSIVSIFFNSGNKVRMEKKDDHEFPSNVAYALELANKQKLTDHEGKPFSIFLDMDKLIKECPSCAVYFQLARYLFILLLFFMIVFAGGVAGLSYYTCTTENFTENGLDIFAGIGSVIGCTYYGGVFRQNRPDLSIVHSLSYLGWIATSYVLIIIFMVKLEVMAVSQTNKSLTASDFTLVFRKLPKSGVKLEDLQELINSIDSTCRVVKIEKVYEVPDAQELISSQQKLEYLVQKMENSNESPRVLRDAKKNLARIESRIGILRTEIQSESLFTGTCFVSFETMEQADRIYSKYAGGILDQIKRNIVFALSLTMVDYSYKSRKWRVNGKICSIKRPPILPEEVIWENYFRDKTRGARVKIRFYIGIIFCYIVFGFLAFCGYIFSYNNAVELYFKAESYKVYDLYSTLYIAVYLITINFIARKILAKLCREIKEEDLLASASIEFMVLIIHFLITYIIVHYAVLFWVVSVRLNEYETNSDTSGNASGTNVKSYIFVTRSLFVLSGQFIGDVLTEKFLSILKCILLRFYSMIWESHLIQYESNTNCQLPAMNVVPSLSAFVSILIFISFYANVTWIVTIIPMGTVIVDYWIEKFFIFRVYQAPKRTPLSLFANSFKLILIFNFILSGLTNFYPIHPLFGEYKINNITLYIMLLLLVIGSTFVFHVVYSPQAVKDRARLMVKDNDSYKSLKYSEAVLPEQEFSHFNPLKELQSFLQTHLYFRSSTLKEGENDSAKEMNNEESSGRVSIRRSSRVQSNASSSDFMEESRPSQEAVIEMAEVQTDLNP